MARRRLPAAILTYLWILVARTGNRNTYQTVHTPRRRETRLSTHKEH